MKSLLDHLSPEYLSVSLVQPGCFDIEVTRSTHSKTASCTIIAQAYEGRYGIACDGREEFSEPEGAFLARAGDYLTIHHLGDPRTGRMKARWLHVCYSLWETIDVLSLVHMPRIVSPEVGRELGAVIARLLELGESSTLQAAVQKQTLAWSALDTLLQVCTPREDSEEQLARYSRFHPVFVHIRSHLPEPITVDELAAIACMSPSRLFAVFQQWLHCSPMEYVKRLRINQAAQLLVSTDQTLNEIAAAVGFSNPFHFSREFKNLFGMPPTKYRQMH